MSKKPGEFQLIQRVQTMLAPQSACLNEQQVVLGIGDDCAVFQGREEQYFLVTTDMLVEGVHFSRDYSCLRHIGQKAMSVNLSDIAAMGGEPRFAFICLALPLSFSLEEFDELWGGLIETAKKFSVLILGGDTNASFPQADKQGLVINITLMGEVCPNELITRQTAREGDLILLTGQIGDSAAGLDLLRSLPLAEQKSALEQYSEAIKRHQTPVLRLAESRIISQHHLATAMIDVSDGLAGDLRHLCRGAELGATLWSDRLPISEAVKDIARLFSKSPLTYALGGGEDYELLFTSAPDQAEEARQMVEHITSTRVSIIGKITDKTKGIHLINPDGHIIWAPKSGFDHFKN